MTHPSDTNAAQNATTGFVAAGCLISAAMVTRLWLRVVHRFAIVGAEHLPGNRSFVMVANHTSHLDAVALMAALPWRQLRRSHPAAAADYFFRHPPAALLSRLLVNAIPFARHGGGDRSLARCRALLARPRRALIFFPEGSRSADGELTRFRSGIGRLVAGTDIPVVPCYLEGAGRAWPKGRLLPRPHGLRLIIGAPRLYQRVGRGKRSACRVARDLEEAVRVLGSGSDEAADTRLHPALIDRQP